MIRIGVCDDIPFYAETLSVVIDQWSVHRHLQVQVKKFLSGEEVLCDAEQMGKFTAVFLDVELTGITGVETAAKLRRMDKYVSIIFMTQYDCYFRKMLELHPCYFLEKPVRKRNVFEILDRIVDENKYSYAIFRFRYGRTLHSIFLKRVLYFFSEKRKIHIVLEDKREYVFYCKLDDVENKLSEYALDFIRIHKSFLVNSRHVEQYHYNYILMSDSKQLPISREYRERVSGYHMKLLKEI